MAPSLWALDEIKPHHPMEEVMMIGDALYVVDFEKLSLDLKKAITLILSEEMSSYFTSSSFKVPEAWPGETLHVQTAKPEVVDQLMGVLGGAMLGVGIGIAASTIIIYSASGLWAPTVFIIGGGISLVALTGLVVSTIVDSSSTH